MISAALMVVGTVAIGYVGGKLVARAVGWLLWKAGLSK